MSPTYYKNLTTSIKNMQGWNDATMTMLLEQFLDSKGLSKEFSEYCKEVADTENEATNVDLTFDFL